MLTIYIPLIFGGSARRISMKTEKEATVGTGPRISIVIPVYNQEAYIEECLGSILAQTLGDFEVVMVDDGSTDGTMEIVGRLVSDDDRFKVISYGENRGTSQARKDAVLATRGKYVMFVDPDDTLSPDACAVALDAIEEAGVDILQFGTSVINCGVNDAACHRFSEHCAPYGARIDADTLFFACLDEKLFNFNLWNKIYDGGVVRRAFAEVKDGYYPKAQDFYAFVIIAYFAKSYASVSTPLYNYCFGRGITGKRSITLDRFSKITTQMHIVEQLYLFFDKQYPEDIAKYTDVLMSRGRMLFNEMLANYTYVENVDEVDREALDLMLDGTMPTADESEYKHPEVYFSYLSAVFSYLDVLTYEKNFDLSQLVIDRTADTLRRTGIGELDIPSRLFLECRRLFDPARAELPVVPVVFATNDAYAPYLGVAIQSLIENASSDRIYDVYIFHTALSETHQLRLTDMSTERVHIRAVNLTPYVKNIKTYSHSHYSVEMYYRILIPEILKDFDKAVYLDCDLVLLADVSKLYDVELGESIIAASVNNIVSDNMKSYLANTLNIPEEKYFNSGVLVINCRKFREQGIKERCFEILNTAARLSCPDQDILNLSCLDRVLYLGREWNFQVGSGAYNSYEKYRLPKNIVHYTSGVKPWNTEGLEAGEPFWKYARLCPYYEEILAGYMSRTLKIRASSVGTVTGSGERVRNVINLKHRKKSVLSWPFRMIGAFFKSLHRHGWGVTMDKTGLKLRYVFGRLTGKVDRYNNPIYRSESPFGKETHSPTEPVKDYAYYDKIPVSKYDRELEAWYNDRTGSNMNIAEPKTFNEKIQWLKIHDATMLKSHLSDKYLAKEYIRSLLGEEYIIKTLGVFDRFEDIDFDTLPDKFVIKSTHGSGQVAIVKDKSALDKEKLRQRTQRWLSTNYAFNCGFEVHYYNMIPRLIVEEFMEGINDDLYDYKFMCINGKVEFIWVDTDRFTDHRRNLYDSEWNLLPERLLWENSDKEIPKPCELEKLIKLSERLSRGFALVRCDFYILPDGGIKFGELTFTSASGIDKWIPDEADVKYGEMLALPEPVEFKKCSQSEIIRSEREFLKKYCGGKEI